MYFTTAFAAAGVFSLLMKMYDHGAMKLDDFQIVHNCFTKDKDIVFNSKLPV